MIEDARRAAPLPPEERRAAILVATVPLLREHGLGVTTRQIARAAGVAEGTLFRVFPDKASLLRAAIAHALEPSPVVAELAGVDRDLPLDERLLGITTLVQNWLHRVIGLLAAVRMHRPPAGRRDGAVAWNPPPRPSNAELLDAIADLLEPDRDALTTTPQEVARLLCLLTFAGTHFGITDGRPLPAAEIVSLLLDGVRRHDSG